MLCLPFKELRGEWPSGLYSLHQVTEVKLGRVRSDSGWVTSEVWPHNSPRRPSEGKKTRGPMPGCGMHSGPKLASSS